MPKSSLRPKLQNFNLRISAELESAFRSATESEDRPAAQVIRDLMQAYVDEHRKPEPGHDNWFRSRVEAALNDPRPSAPHDAVAARAQMLLKRLAADQQICED